MVTNTSLPESPATQNWLAISPEGFPVNFTFRYGSISESVEEAPQNEKFLLDAGFKPQEVKKTSGGGNSAFPTKEVHYVEGRLCPLCDNKLVYATTKNGKKMIKCSTAKWDFMRKEATGCKFIEWINDTTPQSFNETTRAATPAQKSLIENLMMEDRVNLTLEQIHELTFDQAKTIISNAKQ